MATRGKSINLFLVDGNPNGLVKCTLTNWTGVAYKIPRTELEKCKGRDDPAYTFSLEPLIKPARASFMSDKPD